MIFRVTIRCNRYSLAFDSEGRLLVGGGSMSKGNRWRLALARFIVK